MSQIEALKPPDSFHLRAAIGWLELGNHLEANEELECISAQLRAHPDVLEVRWQIYAKEEKWEACEELARAITQMDSTRAWSWIHLAYSIRRAKSGGLQQALEMLQSVADKFPDEIIIPFNLACYACQLKQMNDARTWLDKAFAIGKAMNRFDEIRLMALDEPDLEALWGGINNK